MHLYALGAFSLHCYQATQYTVTELQCADHVSQTAHPPIKLGFFLFSSAVHREFTHERAYSTAIASDLGFGPSAYTAGLCPLLSFRLDLRCAISSSQRTAVEPSDFMTWWVLENSAHYGQFQTHGPLTPHGQVSVSGPSIMLAGDSQMEYIILYCRWHGLFPESQDQAL